MIEKYLEVKLEQLKEIQKLDTEYSHKLADELLCEILSYFSESEFYGRLQDDERQKLQEIIHTFRNMSKWYS